MQEYALQSIEKCDVLFELLSCKSDVAPVLHDLPVSASITQINARKKNVQTEGCGYGDVKIGQAMCYVRGRSLELLARGRSKATRTAMLAAFRKYSEDNHEMWYDAAYGVVRKAGKGPTVMQPTVEPPLRRHDGGNGVIELPRLEYRGSNEQGEAVWKNLAGALGLSTFHALDIKGACQSLPFPWNTLRFEDGNMPLDLIDWLDSQESESEGDGAD